MMQITFHHNFDKHYRKRISFDKTLVTKFQKRYKQFEKDSQDPELKDHGLSGKWQGYRAFWITGDIRIVYKKLSGDEAVFVDIGSHNQVY